MSTLLQTWISRITFLLFCTSKCLSLWIVNFEKEEKENWVFLTKFPKKEYRFDMQTLTHWFENKLER
jgi:hypothetical protein